ncbi:MAG: hypothetical protein HQ596_07385 [Candidatus Saganbacteria bacterium]|nr:hypothetical protein [Candidatus Saganbacteria bacterium]
MSLRIEGQALRFLDHTKNIPRQLAEIIGNRRGAARKNEAQLRRLCGDQAAHLRNLRAGFAWCDTSAHDRESGFPIPQLISCGDLTFISDISVARPIPHDDPTWHPLGFWSSKGESLLAVIDCRSEGIARALNIQHYLRASIVDFVDEHCVSVPLEQVAEIAEIVGHSDPANLWQLTIGRYANRWLMRQRREMFSGQSPAETKLMAKQFYPHVVQTIEAFLGTMDPQDIPSLKFLVIGPASGLVLQMIRDKITEIAGIKKGDESQPSLLGMEPVEELVSEGQARGFDIERGALEERLPFDADSFHVVIDLGMLSQGTGERSFSDQAFGELYRVSKKADQGEPTLTVVASLTQILPSPEDEYVSPAERLGGNFYISGLVRYPTAFAGLRFQPNVQDHYVLQALPGVGGMGGRQPLLEG